MKSFKNVLRNYLGFSGGGKKSHWWWSLKNSRKKTVCIKYGTLSVKELNQTSQQKTVSFVNLLFNKNIGNI